MVRETEQLHSDKELARRELGRVRGDLRPWVTGPAIWVGAIVAGGLLAVLLLIFLLASGA